MTEGVPSSELPQSHILTITDEQGIILPDTIPHDITSRTLSGNWDSEISQSTADNRVGRIGNYAVKQSKLEFESSVHAQHALEHFARVVALHSRFLGDYIPQTSAFAAETEQTWHTYIIQDWIEGSTVKSLPADTRRDPTLVESYDKLYKRLYTIYRAERDINRYIPQNERFELTKIQPIGQRADERRLRPVNMVESENLMVHPHTGKFYIIDFGAWHQWNLSMQKSYDKIVTSAQRKFDRHIREE